MLNEKDGWMDKKMDVINDNRWMGELKDELVCRNMDRWLDGRMDPCCINLEEDEWVVKQTECLKMTEQIKECFHPLFPTVIHPSLYSKVRMPGAASHSPLLRN